MRWRLLALALGCFALGCGAPPPPPPQADTEAVSTPEATPTGPLDNTGIIGGLGLEQELEDVTFRQSRGAVVQWELHAAHVLQRGEGPAELTGVTLEYFGEDSPRARVTADEAEYDLKSQNATLRGNVHVATDDGDSLESAELAWNAEQEILETETEVTLRRGESYITGRGLRTSPGLRDAQLFEVRGVIRGEQLAG